MPREHSAITLTDDEIVEFVSSQDHCIVATLDGDGSPWGDVAACTYHDGMLYFRVVESSRALRNLEADPRVCCTLESKDADYYSAIAAMVHGTASRVADGREPSGELQRLPDPVIGAPIHGVVFGVDLHNVVSFDFSKIQRRFEQ